jgi:hypothetical protein
MTPLWVISLFVSLCDIVAGLAITQARGSVQIALTVFIMAFPVLVASAFFAILWKKPYVLYPPTEFGPGASVSEYVQALGGMSSFQVAEQQMRLFIHSSQESRTSESEKSAQKGKEVTQPVDPGTIHRRELVIIIPLQVYPPHRRAILPLRAFLLKWSAEFRPPK